MPTTRTFVAALLGATILTATAGRPAAAQDAASLAAIQSQINALQAELRQMRAEMARRDGQVRAAQAEATRARTEARQAQRQAPIALPAAPLVVTTAPPPALPPGVVTQPPTTNKEGINGSFRLGGITVTLDGFTDVTGIYRSRNLTAGTSTPWNAIPFRFNPNYKTGEFRATAQQSRLSLLFQGNPFANSAAAVAGYVEMDLNAAATTANSVSTNSYTPRLRHAYVQYDDPTLLGASGGLHVLAGQEWSLLTQNTVGIIPRKEQVPPTIDSQYLPGFTFARVPQLRVAADLGNKYWFAASLESPQTVYSVNSALASGTRVPAGISAAGEVFTYSNTGSGNLNTLAAYSIDVAPDLVVKVAADPGFGHYELYGVGRFMKERTSVLGGGSTKVKFAGGVGGAVDLPILRTAPDAKGNRRTTLELTASTLVGYGIGRFGAAGLPDATIGRDGSPQPLPEWQLLVGLLSHPTTSLDVYGYFGLEQIGHKSFATGTGATSTGYGYGSPLFDNRGCGIEASAILLTTANGCAGNTRQLTQGTIGAWYKVLHGGYGTVAAGAQYSYTEREAFRGNGGKPSSNEQIVMTAVRYTPFK